jgi:hypothetical protein
LSCSFYLCDINSGQNACCTVRAGKFSQAHEILYNKNTLSQKKYQESIMQIATRKLYLILLAGLAGGLAEIFWIGIYSTVTHAGGLEISRQITASMLPAWSESSIAPILGMCIHLALSVVLAFLSCRLLMEPAMRRFGQAVVLPSCMAVLAGVWAINFLVILPVINPAFVTLLPFLVTFASKQLFGLAMGAVLLKGVGAFAPVPCEYRL